MGMLMRPLFVCAYQGQVPTSVGTRLKSGTKIVSRQGQQALNFFEFLHIAYRK